MGCSTGRLAACVLAGSCRRSTQRAGTDQCTSHRRHEPASLDPRPSYGPSSADGSVPRVLQCVLCGAPISWLGCTRTASTRSRAIAVKRLSKLGGAAHLQQPYPSPNARGESCFSGLHAAPWLGGIPGDRHAGGVGTSSLRSCSALPCKSVPWTVSPVMLPPGWRGWPRTPCGRIHGEHHDNRDGAGRVLRCRDRRVIFRHDDVDLEAHQLGGEVGEPFGAPAHNRHSKAMLCPSTYPSSCSPWWKGAHLGDSGGVLARPLSARPCPSAAPRLRAAPQAG